MLNGANIFYLIEFSGQRVLVVLAKCHSLLFRRKPEFTLWMSPLDLDS